MSTHPSTDESCELAVSRQNALPREVCIEMNSRAVQSYLSNLGTPVETGSVFTLDPEKAFSKLSTHQLPSPGLWLVKLVQAAVASGASRVAIDLKSSDVRIMVMGCPTQSAKELLAQAAGGAHPVSRANRHWLTALRSALGRHPKFFELVTFQNETLETVTIEKQALRADHSRLSSPVGYSLCLHLTHPTEGPVSFQSERAELLERCSLCPVPIVLDGRDLQQRYHPFQASLAWQAQIGKPSFRAMLLPSGSQTRSRFVPKHQWPAHEQRLFLALGVSYNRSPLAVRAWFMQDGVLVGPFPLASLRVPAKIDIVLPGDGIANDASEWNLRWTSKDLQPLNDVPTLAKRLQEGLEQLPAQRPKTLSVRETALLALGGLSFLLGPELGLAGMLFCGGLTGCLFTTKRDRPPTSLLTALAHLVALDSVELDDVSESTPPERT